MLEVKFKQNIKFATYGKCESIQKRLSDDAINAAQDKLDHKDYMNEIFAGLMWLG